MLMVFSDIISLAPLSRLCKTHQSRLLHLCIPALMLISFETQHWCHLVLFIQFSKYILVSFILEAISKSLEHTSAPALLFPHPWDRSFSLPRTLFTFLFASLIPYHLSRLCSGFSLGKHYWLASLSNWITCLAFICCHTTLCTYPQSLITWLVIISLFISLLPWTMWGLVMLSFIVKFWVTVPGK